MRFGSLGGCCLLKSNGVNKRVLDAGICRFWLPKSSKCFLQTHLNVGLVLVELKRQPLRRVGFLPIAFCVYPFGKVYAHTSPKHLRRGTMSQFLLRRHWRTSLIGHLVGSNLMESPSEVDLVLWISQVFVVIGRHRIQMSQFGMIPTHF